MKRIALVVIALLMIGGAAFSQAATGSPVRSKDSAVSLPTPLPSGQARSGTASPVPQVPLIDLRVRNPQNGKDVAFSIQLLLLLTVLSLAPSILILLTSFLRISIVLDFVKRALSLQQVPPNQVLLG